MCAPLFKLFKKIFIGRNTNLHSPCCWACPEDFLKQGQDRAVLLTFLSGSPERRAKKTPSSDHHTPAERWPNSENIPQVGPGTVSNSRKFNSPPTGSGHYLHLIQWSLCIPGNFWKCLLEPAGEHLTRKGSATWWVSGEEREGKEQGRSLWLWHSPMMKHLMGWRTKNPLRKHTVEAN